MAHVRLQITLLFGGVAAEMALEFGWYAALQPKVGKHVVPPGVRLVAARAGVASVFVQVLPPRGDLELVPDSEPPDVDVFTFWVHHLGAKEWVVELCKKKKRSPFGEEAC